MEDSNLRVHLWPKLATRPTNRSRLSTIPGQISKSVRTSAKKYCFWRGIPSIGTLLHLLRCFSCRKLTIMIFFSFLGPGDYIINSAQQACCSRDCPGNCLTLWWSSGNRKEIGFRLCISRTKVFRWMIALQWSVSLTGSVFRHRFFSLSISGDHSKHFCGCVKTHQNDLVNYLASDPHPGCNPSEDPFLSNFAIDWRLFPCFCGYGTRLQTLVNGGSIKLTFW